MSLAADLIAAAKAVDLAPNLVTALAQVESDFQCFAWNPEPKYRYLWNVRTHRPFRPLTAAEIASEIPPLDFPALAGARDQEWWGQQCSWGLLQVMGAVAREHGFMEPYLTQLTDPAINLRIGCRHLADLVVWANGDVEQALAAYNGGRAGNAVRPFRNHEYAQKVMAAYGA